MGIKKVAGSNLEKEKQIIEFLNNIKNLEYKQLNYL